MPDAIDALNCSDVVCARSGHYACHDLPPPKPKIGGCAQCGNPIPGDPPTSVDALGGDDG